MRRELLVIATITLLALAAIAVFGGAFRLQPVNEPPPQVFAPPVAATLPDPVVGGPGWDQPKREGKLYTLEVAFKAAGTLAPVEGRKLVQVVDLQSTVLAEIATFDAFAYFNLPANAPVRVLARTPGWFDVESAPIVIAPQARLSVDLLFQRPVPVTINVNDPYFRASRHAYFYQPELPRFPEVEHRVEHQVVMNHSVRAMLRPGRWVCAFAEQRSYGVETLSLPQPCRVLEFEVGHVEIELEIDMTAPVPGQTLTGTVVDEDGLPAAGARVWVEILGPGPLVRSHDNSYTSESGRFQFLSVPEGIWRVSVDVAAGRVVALVAPAQQGQEARLKLARWVGKERGVMPVQQIGSVQILRRGLPVPGASIHEEGSGQLAGWSMTLRNNNQSPVAGEDGVVQLDAPRWDGDWVVQTRPHSARLFEARVRPGSDVQAVFELAPPGTAILRADLGAVAKHISHVKCEMEGRDGYATQQIKLDESGGLEVCGLEPGNYRLIACMRHGFGMSLAIDLAADQELILDRPFAVRSVSGNWPSWVVGGTAYEVYLADPDDPMNRVMINQDWSALPLALKQAPSTAHQLVVWKDGRAVAVADVPAGTGDVSALVWRRLAAPENEGGRLMARWKADFDRWADLWIGEPGNPPVLVRCGSATPDSQGFELWVHDVPVGEWRVIVCKMGRDWRRPSEFNPVLDRVVKVRRFGLEVVELATLPEVPPQQCEVRLAGDPGPGIWHVQLEATQQNGESAFVINDRRTLRPTRLYRRGASIVLAFGFRPRPGEQFNLLVPGFAPREFVWPEGHRVDIDLRH